MGLKLQYYTSGIDVHVDIEHDGKRHCQGKGRGGGGKCGRGDKGRRCGKKAPWRQGEQKAAEKMEEAKNGNFNVYDCMYKLSPSQL